MMITNRISLRGNTNTHNTLNTHDLTMEKRWSTPQIMKMTSCHLNL